MTLIDFIGTNPTLVIGIVLSLGALIGIVGLFNHVLRGLFSFNTHGFMIFFIVVFSNFGGHFINEGIQDMKNNEALYAEKESIEETDNTVQENNITE